ncbi:MAG: anaerobic ribonucleoside-triphosphate reductase activating protein [Candidatus Margulisiibacteriota bacterium]
MDLEIKGFHETSFLDWDGKIVSVVYLPLCNLRCPFCHNSGLVEAPQSYSTIPKEKIFAFLDDHLDFIDGVCITGGEPTLHKDKGLFEFAREIKNRGLLVKIDSNGTDPDCLQKLIDENLIDYVAMDIKGPINERYSNICRTKVDIEKIKKSIGLIMSRKIHYEFRTTVVPTLLSFEDVVGVARSIAGAEKYALQQFKAENCWEPEMLKIKPYSKEELELMAKAAQAYVSNTILRGV